MMVEDMCSSPFLSRRQFIGSSASCLFAGSIADAQPRLPQFAVADISNDINVNLVEIDRRLSILKSIGFDMIRTEIGWSDFEIVEGQWKINDARLRYLDAVKRSGLKIKVVISTYSNAPMWFFERHENAKLFNSYGKSPSSLISPWYPDVSKVVEDVQTRIFTDLASYGIFDFTNSIIADLGPAAEAIYPASWETIGKRPSSFWFYGDLARKSFMDYALRHYGSLDILNSHWNVNLTHISQVEIHLARELKGSAWELVLTWYRDSKRKVSRTILNYTCKNIKNHVSFHEKTCSLIILLPGSHLTPETIQRAISTGDGNDDVKVMIDSEYLIQMARDLGADLQLTAGENLPEILYVQAVLAQENIHSRIWIENSGGSSDHEIASMLSNFQKQGIYGFDYIKASDLFDNEKRVSKIGKMIEQVISNQKSTCLRAH